MDNRKIKSPDDFLEKFEEISKVLSFFLQGEFVITVFLIPVMIKGSSKDLNPSKKDKEEILIHNKKTIIVFIYYFTEYSFIYYYIWKTINCLLYN